MAYKGPVPEQVTKDNFNKHSGYRNPSPRSMPRPSRDRPNIAATSVQNRQRTGHSEEATYRPTVEKAWQDNCDRPFGTRPHQAIDILPLLFLTRQGCSLRDSGDGCSPALMQTRAAHRRCQDPRTQFASAQETTPLELASGVAGRIVVGSRQSKLKKGHATPFRPSPHTAHPLWTHRLRQRAHQHGWPADAMFQDGLGLR